MERTKPVYTPIFLFIFIIPKVCPWLFITGFCLIQFLAKFFEIQNYSTIGLRCSSYSCLSVYKLVKYTLSEITLLLKHFISRRMSICYYTTFFLIASKGQGQKNNKRKHPFKYIHTWWPLVYDIRVSNGIWSDGLFEVINQSPVMARRRPVSSGNRSSSSRAAFYH